MRSENGIQKGEKESWTYLGIIFICVGINSTCIDCKIIWKLDGMWFMLNI